MLKNSLFKDDLPSLSIRRPVLILVINLLIITAGVAALFNLEVRELPDVDRPIITVRANYPGAAPETVDAEVTSRLEGAVARVNGVKSINASSEEGNSRVRVEFRPGIDIEDAANETRESVAQVQRGLPNEVENLSIVKADNDARGVVDIAVSSDRYDLETLTEIVETDLAPLFLNVPGVADVSLNGETANIPLTYEITGNAYTFKGVMNLENWNALDAVASINKACEALHTGADGVSKTWNDVAVQAQVLLEKK